MRKSLLTFVIFLFLSLTTFAKDGLDYTYTDFIGKKKAQVRESILKTGSQELLDTLDKIIEDIEYDDDKVKLYKKKTLKFMLKEFRVQFANKRICYDIAIERLKSRVKLADGELKIPRYSLDTYTDIIMNDMYDEDPLSNMLMFIYNTVVGGVRKCKAYTSVILWDKDREMLIEDSGSIKDWECSEYNIIE